MHRSIPAPNKLLQKKWRDLDLEMHHRRIADMRSIVKTTAPLKTHLGTSKSKKERIEEDRRTEIERDNHILVEKMSSIMRSRSSARVLVTTPAKSLNKDLRKKELVQVTIENLSLLNRIQGQKSCYDVKKFEGNRKFHERMLRHMCEFPYSLGRSSSTRNLSTADYASLRNPAETESLRNSTSNKALATTNPKPRRLVPLEQDEVVFRIEKNIGQQTYLVAVMKSSSHYTLIVQELGKTESFLLKLSYPEAKLMMKNSEDYAGLINALEVDDGELVLGEPTRSTLPQIDYNATGTFLDSVNEQPNEHGEKEQKRPSNFVFPTSDSEDEVESRQVQVKQTVGVKADDIGEQGSISFESKKSKSSKDQKEEDPEVPSIKLDEKPNTEEIKSKAEDPKTEDPKLEDSKLEDPKLKDPIAEDSIAKDTIAEGPKAEDPIAKDPKAEDQLYHQNDSPKDAELPKAFE